ncbi:MAG: CHC2 zinc finger domain-containing protein [Myxococcota bacterium]
MIDRQLIDEINARVDLVALIGGVVPLKRVGKDFVGHCPFHDDRTPSFYVIPSKGFFHCFPCGTSGDAIEWTRRTRGLSFREAVDELGARVGITVAPASRPEGPRRPMAPPPRKEAPPPVYPPVDSVAGLWAACGRLDAARSTEPAIPWLERFRNLDVGMMAALDLARLLPLGGDLPVWVPRLGMDRGEFRALYRLVVPLFDAEGALRAVRFRAVDRVRDGVGDGWRLLNVPRQRKSILSVGCTSKGLVVADPMAQALLRGQREHEGVVWDHRVVIAEGEPDAWTWATAARRRKWAEERANGAFAARTWATLGIAQGSWTTDLAARIPDGATIILRRHLDDSQAGQRMAAEIVETFAARRRTVRVLWRKEAGREDAA